MSLPLDITFAAGDTDYIPNFNAVVSGVNELNTLVTTARNLVGTSNSSNSIGTGDKTFVLVEEDRNWAPGTQLVAASTANPANSITGRVKSYDTATKTLVLTGTATAGSGTITAWSFSLAGAVAALDSLSPGALSDGALRVLGGVIGTYNPDGGLPITSKTSSFTAVSGNAYSIEGNSITVALPTSPTVGQTIELLDGNGTFTGGVIDPGSEKIAGATGTQTFTPGDLPLKLSYLNSSRGWIFRG